MSDIEFEPFPKIPRLNREIVVTEKIDGTNAQVCITEDGDVFAGSRKRWITPEQDNFGFAKWVEANRDELLRLGPGRHFGEWWGKGIQRGYGLDEKRFSLFNVGRWYAPESGRPECCHIVPILYEGPLSTDVIEDCLVWLREDGSYAAPGFDNPEGVIVFHKHSRSLFKATIENDEIPKSHAA